MKTFIAVYWASALFIQGTLGVEEPCQTRTEWGETACSLGGSLGVKSVPNNLEVTSLNQKCDLFYRKSEFQKQPLVFLPDAKSGEKYTVVMVDPDAPKHPKGSYYLHWIAADIAGDDFKKGDLKKSKTLTAYRGPSPPKDSGTHRYIVLAFRQPRDTSVTGVAGDRRAMFNLGEWLNKQKLCGPVSGLQFRTNFSGNPKSES